MSGDHALTGSEQLHELSPEVANAILNRFLELEQAYFLELEIPGVVLDRSEASVKALLRWVLQSGTRSGFDAGAWYARCGYYFGECLLAQSKALSWDIGETGYAFENHPVIVGFKDKMEAPLIAVCKNVLQSIEEGRCGVERIDSTVSLHFASI